MLELGFQEEIMAKIVDPLLLDKQRQSKFTRINNVSFPKSKLSNSKAYIEK